MAGSVTFRVTSKMAARRAAAPIVRQIALQLRADAAAATPRDSGILAANWQLLPGDDPGTWFVQNPTPYARYVEYGTKHRNADPFFGRVIARYRARYGSRA